MFVSPSSHLSILVAVSPSSFLFVQISCTFQWYRVSNGSEHVIQGADKASYVVKKHDVGHFLKVVTRQWSVIPELKADVP